VVRDCPRYFFPFPGIRGKEENVCSYTGVVV
jgi:hypothetical protein